MALGGSQMHGSSSIIVASIQVQLWAQAESLDAGKVSHGAVVEQFLVFLMCVVCFAVSQNILVVYLEVVKRELFGNLSAELYTLG